MVLNGQIMKTVKAIWSHWPLLFEKCNVVHKKLFHNFCYDSKVDFYPHGNMIALCLVQISFTTFLILWSTLAQITYFLCKRKYHCTAVLLFYLFAFNCYAFIEWTTILFVWSNPNQSNRRSALHSNFLLQSKQVLFVLIIRKKGTLTAPGQTSLKLKTLHDL